MITTDLIAFLQRAEVENGGPLPVWLCVDDHYYRLSSIYLESAEYFQVTGTDDAGMELPDRVEIFVG